MLDQHNLKDALTYACKAAAKDDLRPILNGVLCEIRGGRITFVGCDGYRLHKVTMPIKRGYHNDGQFPTIDEQTAPAENETFVIPLSDANKIKSTIKLTGSMVSILITPNGVQFEQYYRGKTWQHTFAPTKGRFPAYDYIIPVMPESAIKFKLDSSFLDSAAYAFGDIALWALIPGNEHYTRVVLANPSEGLAKHGTIYYLTINNPVLFGMSPRYMLDAMTEEAYTTYSYNKPTAPFLVTINTKNPNIDQLAVIMPMSTRDNNEETVQTLLSTFGELADKLKEK